MSNCLFVPLHAGSSRTRDKTCVLPWQADSHREAQGEHFAKTLVTDTACVIQSLIGELNPNIPGEVKEPEHKYQKKY